MHSLSTAVWCLFALRKGASLFTVILEKRKKRFVLSLGMSLAVLLGLFPKEMRAGEAMEAAVELLESLKVSPEDRIGVAGEVEFQISPFLGPEKASLIARDWKRFIRWRDREASAYLRGAERTEGNLAAVIVAVRSHLAPENTVILPLALVKSGGFWKVGPVPGSFQNTGWLIGGLTSKKVESLENWMAEQQAQTGQKILEEEQVRYREQMYEVVSKEDLLAANSREALEAFLKAVREKDAAKVFLWSGGLERDVFPELDRAALQVVIRDGLQGKDERDTWRLLVEDETLSLIAEEKEDEETASYLVLMLTPEPVGIEKAHFVAQRFNLERSALGWRVDVPVFFAGANLKRRTYQRLLSEMTEYHDQKKRDHFPHFFEQKWAARRAETVQEVMDGMIEALKKRDLKEFLRWQYRPTPHGPVGPKPEAKQEMREDLGAFADEARDLIEEEMRRLIEDRELGFENGAEGAGEVLEDVIEENFQGERAGGVRRGDRDRKRRYLDALKAFTTYSGVADLEVLQVLEEGKIAVALVSHSQGGQSWEREISRFWFLKQGESWAFAPGLLLQASGILPPEERENMEPLLKRVAEEQKRVAESRTDSLLERVELLTPEAVDAPGDDEARQAIRQYQEAVLEGKWEELLELTAVLKRPAKPNRFLEDLALVMRGRKTVVEPDQILGVRSEGAFTGVSMLVDAGRGLEVQAPLRLVVQTEKGVRVLAGVELELPTNGGKKLRNQDALESLGQVLDLEAFEALKRLYEWHQALAQPAYEKWNAEKKR